MRGVVVGVKQWQRDHGLTDDGVWGPKSRAAAGDGDTERPEPVDPPSPVADGGGPDAPGCLDAPGGRGRPRGRSRSPPARGWTY